MAGDVSEAREHLQAARKWSADVGFASGFKEAADALERLETASTSPAAASQPASG